MTQYRRHFQAGVLYFFYRQPGEPAAVPVDRRCRIVARGIRYTLERHPFTLEASVALPEHLHAIWTLPPGDTDYSTRWRLIKSHFSRALPADERRSASHLDKGERGIWQRRYWEHTLRDEADFQRHADYIHFNPVKHGHVNRVAGWPYSSFHRDVRLGMYAPVWAGIAGEEGSGSFGEAT